MVFFSKKIDVRIDKIKKNYLFLICIDFDQNQFKIFQIIMFVKINLTFRQCQSSLNGEIDTFISKNKLEIYKSCSRNYATIISPFFENAGITLEIAEYPCA